MRIRVEGIALDLRGDGSVFRGDLGTLYVADLHLGKASAFRAFGVPVPEGACTETLRCLQSSIKITGARRVVLLGDVWHDARALAANREAWMAWREAREERFEIVLGNHDRRAAVDAAALGFDPLGDDSPLRCLHEPPEEIGPFALCGHVHPVARIGMERVRVFWRRRDALVLPAFGGFTGGCPVSAGSGERLYAAAGDRAVRIA